MKLLPTFLFLCFALTLYAQHPNNELPVPADSKKALKTVEKNRKIRNRSKSRRSRFGTEQSITKSTLNRNALSYNHQGVKKERQLFEVKRDKYAGTLVTLLDLEGYKPSAKNKVFRIKAGEKIQLLKEKRKKYKIKYAGKTLFVDRQYYVAKRD